MVKLLCSKVKAMQYEHHNESKVYYLYQKEQNFALITKYENGHNLFNFIISTSSLTGWVYHQMTSFQYIMIVCLKVYANHLSGFQVMATIGLQCNSLSQIHSSVYFRLKIL